MDANVWGGDSAFSALKGFDIKVGILEHHQITPETVRNADILIVRSSTRVNEALLAGSSVRFVATATIGDDHVDKDYLKRNKISFSSAAGSSTESVVEYMLSALYQSQQQLGINLQQQTLGIIGVGRIGSLLDKACRNTGLKTLLNDPPRAQLEGSQNFCSLDELLEQSDILTLHTPLTKQGSFKTMHLLGAKELNRFQGRGIINAGRGACLDNSALLQWLNRNPNHFAILDCWEDEPDVLLELVNHPQLTIATPHIAGHSLDGKAANTLFVYRDLCRHLKVAQTWDVESFLPAIAATELSPELTKQTLTSHLYPIEEDSSQMKLAALDSASFARWFSSYRRFYPVRRSWRKILASQTHFDKELFF